MRYLLPVLAFSVVVSACKDRAFNSEVANTDASASKNMVTIHVENAPMAQPIALASGDCRGGSSTYKVPNRDENPGWDPFKGMPFPDLKVDVSVKAVTMCGMAGGGSGGGQDFASWTLPAGLKGGETLTIKGDKIFVSGATGNQGGTSNAELSCDSYGGKLVVAKVGEKYTATITGKAAELIRDEQGKPVTAIGGGYDSGKTWETKKRLPQHWTLSTNFDKPSEAPQVTVKELVKGSLGFYADQYSPSVVKESTGYKFVLVYHEMTGSHNTVGYEYANWFFPAKDCK
jgi:hypothetical protein